MAFIYRTLLFVVALIAPGQAAVVTMPPVRPVTYGTGAHSGMYEVDLQSGALVRLDREDSSTSLRIGLSINPVTGEIIADENAFPSGFRRFDLATGQFQLVFAGRYNEIAFSPTGLWYTQDVADVPSAFGPLVILDPANGQTQVVSPDLRNLRGLAYNPLDNLLYGVTSSAGGTTDLLAINPETAQIESQLPLGPEVELVGALLILPNGNAILSEFRSSPVRSGYLSDLDLATGALSNTRPVADGVFLQGLAFVPEPSIFFLSGLGAFMMIARRRRYETPRFKSEVQQRSLSE